LSSITAQGAREARLRNVASAHQALLRLPFIVLGLDKNQRLSKGYEISTKVVHKFVEKHPLDVPEPGWNAAFNTLPIV
jgi:hypothetical protein